MKSLKATFVLTIFLGFVKCRDLNNSILVQQFGYSIDSSVIDLNGLSIDSIDLKTFEDYSKLEVLYLDDNKINKIEYGLFNKLTNLKELWLESNSIIAIDKNSLLGLNNLRLVCLRNNPISNLFPNSLSVICETNKECIIKVFEKCIRNENLTTTTQVLSTTTTKITTFASGINIL